MKKIFLLLCGLFCLCVSCKRGLTLKVDNGSIGKASEVLVVMNKSIFGTIMEDSIRTLLAIPQPGINQIEGMFDALVLDETLIKNARNFDEAERLERFIYHKDSKIFSKFIKGNKIF